ncbi:MULTISPECIES: hypothetical protein [Acinetobacter]|uniref:hypothetical protein n=1 Tax=Acinetobacter TaxID=469 RepID=UPI001C45B021|nr:hypothetical protein [Acinetobacter baumannii]
MTFNEWLGTQGNLALVHANCCRIAYEAGQQSMQAKVEELEGKLKQAYEDVDTFAEARERECGFKAQLAKDRAELQKRVDAVIIEIENMYLSGAIGFDTVKKLEQALKGGEA